MAERRMFAKTIIDSDAFLDMPMSTQCLYFHLAMRADDEGFINNPKRICRTIGASEDDLRVLIGKRFIIPFDSGIVVIKHWRIHNYIKSDRFKETEYKQERATLTIKENGAYTERQPVGDELEPKWNQNGTKMEPQVRIGKDSIGNNIENAHACIRHKYGAYKNVLLSDDDLEKVKAEFPQDWESRIERVSEYCAQTGKTYKSYLATIRAWARRNGTTKPADKEQKASEWDKMAERWANE